MLACCVSHGAAHAPGRHGAHAWRGHIGACYPFPPAPGPAKVLQWPATLRTPQVGLWRRAAAASCGWMPAAVASQQKPLIGKFPRAGCLHCCLLPLHTASSGALWSPPLPTHSFTWGSPHQAPTHQALTLTAYLYSATTDPVLGQYWPLLWFTSDPEINPGCTDTGQVRVSFLPYSIPKDQGGSKGLLTHTDCLMDYCKTVVSPVHQQWRYHIQSCNKTLKLNDNF